MRDTFQMPTVSDRKPTKPRSAAGRLLRRFIGDRQGVAAIEFAVLAIPFFLFIFAILESCLSFAAQQVLSNAMDNVARAVRTGQLPALTESQLKKAICDHIEVIVGSDCMTNGNLNVDLRSYTTFKAAATDTYTVVGGNIFIKRNTAVLPLQVTPGASLTINTLRVFYKWPVITDVMRTYMANIGGNKTLLFATTTWQNEPFDD